MSLTDNFAELSAQMATTPFVDGEPARLVHLTNQHGMSVSFMDIGAAWLSCCLPVNAQPREVLLRSPSMAEYLKQGAYFGAIVGRFANRLAKGQFQIDDTSYQLAINNGENALHGGVTGFDKRRWHIAEQAAQHVVFQLHSADGDDGYPGNLDVSVRYQLTDDNALAIRYEARTDSTCPVNLTNHAYFNLAGAESDATALEHSLQINAPFYLPIDSTLIPTGELKAVKNTGFDFRQPKVLSRDFLADDNQHIASGYDHCFVFSKDTQLTTPVATLFSPCDSVNLRVFTTKPAMQLYTGNFLSGNQGVDAKGNSIPLNNYAGVALETQFFPDAPNQAALCAQASCDDSLLRPAQIYQHQTLYQFNF